MIVNAKQAEAIIAEGKADMIAMARAFLDDPHWGWHAAQTLGAEVARPVQYARVGAGAMARRGLARVTAERVHSALASRAGATPR